MSAKKKGKSKGFAPRNYVKPPSQSKIMGFMASTNAPQKRPRKVFRLPSGLMCSDDANDEDFLVASERIPPTSPQNNEKETPEDNEKETPVLTLTQSEGASLPEAEALSLELEDMESNRDSDKLDDIVGSEGNDDEDNRGGQGGFFLSCVGVSLMGYSQCAIHTLIATTKALMHFPSTKHSRSASHENPISLARFQRHLRLSLSILGVGLSFCLV